MAHPGTDADTDDDESKNFITNYPGTDSDNDTELTGTLKKIQSGVVLPLSIGNHTEQFNEMSQNSANDKISLSIVNEREREQASIAEWLTIRRWSSKDVRDLLGALAK
jgi:hypothetical protein